MRKAGVTKQSPDKHPLTLGSPSCSPRFVCKNNGVLFENQLLQIGVKSEFRQNLGMWGVGWGRCEDGDSGRPCSGVASGLTEAPPSPSLQAACISSTATRPQYSSRASRPLSSTLGTSRLISSRPGPAPAPGLPSWDEMDPGRDPSSASCLRA